MDLFGDSLFSKLEYLKTIFAERYINLSVAEGNVVGRLLGRSVIVADLFHCSLVENAYERAVRYVDILVIESHAVDRYIVLLPLLVVVYSYETTLAEASVYLVAIHCYHVLAVDRFDSAYCGVRVEYIGEVVVRSVEGVYGSGRAGLVISVMGAP